MALLAVAVGQALEVVVAPGAVAEYATAVLAKQAW
jgi:hypothetical protein